MNKAPKRRKSTSLVHIHRYQADKLLSFFSWLKIMYFEKNFETADSSV